MNGRAAGGTTEARKEEGRAPRAASPTGTVTRTMEAREKARTRARVKPDIAAIAEEQEHIGVNCPYKWPYSMDEEDDQTSSWKSELKGENAEELASLETPDEDQIEDEQASSGLNHLGSVDVEENHSGGGLMCIRECDAEEHVSRDGHQADREVQEWKRVQRTRRREHQELWAADHVRQDPLRDLCARAHGRSRT